MFADVVVAPAGAGAGWDIGHLAILLVVIAAVVGIVLIAFRRFGIAVPDFVVQILWICLAAVVAVLAIRFVLSL